LIHLKTPPHTNTQALNNLNEPILADTTRQFIC
jgi:hypothetical protein